MDNTTIKEMATCLFAEHGLADWKLELKLRTGHNLGLTIFKTSTIVLNEYYVNNNPDEMVVDTLLHEVAHALTPGDKHGPAWKKMALALGCVPNFQWKYEAKMPPRKYEAVCPNCAARFQRNSKPSGQWHYHCPRCGKEKGALVFVKL